jgi:hypothetical protein
MFRAMLRLGSTDGALSLNVKMTEEIIRKLTNEILAGINSEAQVVYVMAGIRKLIERDERGEEFPTLKFHCDWVLHSKLEGSAAKQILRLFDSAEERMQQGKTFEQLPSKIRREIDKVSQMESFQEELEKFLNTYGLPSISYQRIDGWTFFLHLYSLVIQDIPLQVGVVKKKLKDPPLKPPPPIIHLSHVTVRCELARETIKHENGEEMLFRIWWTLFPKAGEPKAFWIENSFSISSQ